MTTTRQRNFASRPHKASLAEDASAHDRINSDLDIQRRHAPTAEISDGKPRTRRQPDHGEAHVADRLLVTRRPAGPHLTPSCAMVNAAHRTPAEALQQPLTDPLRAAGRPKPHRRRIWTGIRSRPTATNHSQNRQPETPPAMEKTAAAARPRDAVLTAAASLPPRRL